MKVLMVISEAPPIHSGVARVAGRLSEGLRQKGIQVDLFSLTNVPRMEKGEVRLYTMPFHLKELQQRLPHYDLIHLNGPVPTFSDVFLLWHLLSGAKRSGQASAHWPRLVYTHHAPVDLRFAPLRPLVWLYNHLQERLANLADHVVATTPSYGQRLSRYVPAAKLSVVPWGVDFERFYAPVGRQEPFTVVYLGQVRPYKGLPVLIEAARWLKDTRIWVIGQGHMLAACRRQVRNLGLENITFWGALNDEAMIARLHQAHALVLPSITHSEAFGIVLLEGMAAGLTPVASHLPGVADLIGNEGLTFPPGNARALSETLKRLRADEALRQHLARLAQAKARLYSWERSAFGYERIFLNLTGASNVDRIADADYEPVQRTPVELSIEK